VLDLSQEPGTLDRFGPVSAQHVRLVRPHSFRRVLVDALSGRPIAVDDQPTPAADTPEARREQVQDMLRPDVLTDPDEPQHDPSARLARLIDLRDVRCCGPGCSSSRCDRDHLQPHPDGPTSARNLGLVSPRCHSAKHHGWTLQRHPDRQRHLDQPPAPPLRPTRTLEPTPEDRPAHRATTDPEPPCGCSPAGR
jgi:hypothetical protein